MASLLLGTRSAAHILASFPANRNISTFLLDMAEVSQRFFHPGDVDEMLAKILPSLHGDDIDVSLRFFLDNRRMLHPHKSCMIYSSDTQEKLMLLMCFFVFYLLLHLIVDIGYASVLGPFLAVQSSPEMVTSQ